MKKTKTSILVFAVLTFGLFFSKAQAFDPAYVTSQTVNTGYSESCSWSVTGGYCHCNNYGSYPSECGGHGASNASDCGCPSICGGVASFSQFLSGNCGSNFCTNAGSPPSSRWVSTGSYTSYTCHYISSVSTWSACVNGVQTATSVVWSTVPGSSCANVETARSCNFAPVAQIVSPATDLIGSQAVNYRTFINFSGTGTDQDGDPIVGYEWCVGASGCASPISTSNSFSYGDLPAGSTSQVFLRVRDDQGATHWSEAVSRNVEVKTACLDSSGNPTGAPAGGSFCPGDNDNLPANTTISLVNSAADCSEPKCQYYYLPVNGEVGDAQDSTYCQKPTEELCDSGDPSEVTESADGKYWEWTCEGRYGGTSVQGKTVKSCAYKEVNPQ